jgi:hypothetical protein
MGIIPTILVICLVGTISAAITTAAVPAMTQPSVVFAQNERENIS